MRLTIQDIVEAVQGKLLVPNTESVVIHEITTDSRQMVNQGLFIPLRGERFDGHQFIGQVYDKGAVATLTMEEDIVDSRLVTIWVKDTGKALLDLAQFYRKTFDIPVIGITGSVGKTSTKEMIAATLSGKWNVHKTEGNFNNEIGLPLTLFKLKPEHEVAVIEMGMNHFGEIHNLTTAALPDVAVITNVGTSHIENLGSREGILKAKLEILDGLSSDGLLVINGDNDLLGELKDLSVSKVTYGLNPKNDYWAKNIKNEGMYTLAEVTTPKAQYSIRIKALGEHMVYNTLAAIAIAEHYHLTQDEIMTGLSSYQPAKMRMHITETEYGLTLLDDTYNASPDSMKAALRVLMDYQSKGRKVAILGDMFEMGEFAPQLHQEVGAFAESVKVDLLISIGELAQQIDVAYKSAGGKKAIYFPTKEDFVREIKHIIEPADCILFKASRGMFFETLVEETRKVK
ncbi:MAG: UDP-N-acetylmuramoyl-tripeptide--D-alanyl-D-alanine ligase [Cellulosilyticum sp.]|nr:UDP-N-acetylmuramoyl-tripeptide--D-alanyl-D-alanine ligase [Cellulosilyticum sp.]